MTDISNTDSGPRIGIFTHDTFGLGHVRRSLNIVRAVAERAPESALLLITGSPALHALHALPRNADYVKVPTVVKTGNPDSQPPHLPMSVTEVTHLRERLIRETVMSFRPDVFIVDNFPLGSRKELLPTLEAMRECSTRTVLGLRDILDAPETVREEWARQGTYEILDRFYDRILVYGTRDVMDIADAYSLPADIAARVSYCGYVTSSEPPERTAEEVRTSLGVEGPFVLATVGGGGDGLPLLRAFVQALHLIPDVPAVVVTGPLMSRSNHAELDSLAVGLPKLTVLDYVKDLASLIAAASVTVSMCGYNTAAELVALRANAIVVPRTWRYGEHANRLEAGVEWEQLLRARALADLGMVRLIEPENLTPERLAERISVAIASPGGTDKSAIDISGLEAVAKNILELTGHRQVISAYVE